MSSLEEAAYLLDGGVGCLEDCAYFHSHSAAFVDLAGAADLWLVSAYRWRPQ